MSDSGELKARYLTVTAVGKPECVQRAPATLVSGSGAGTPSNWPPILNQAPDGPQRLTGETAAEHIRNAMMLLADIFEVDVEPRHAVGAVQRRLRWALEALDAGLR